MSGFVIAKETDGVQDPSKWYHFFVLQDHSITAEQLMLMLFSKHNLVIDLFKVIRLFELPLRRTLVCNKIVDHSDVVGASPVGAAPTTSSFST